MGVIPTPTNYKTFTFDGENSRSYGVYITGEGVFNAPERNVEMVEIPGRNGAFALDKGNFNNIEVTYPAGIFAETEADFAQAVSDLRNFLCSRAGYVRLEDDYNPNEYRLAIYKSGLDVDHDFLIAGEFDLVFECKPQRYLKSGETPISVTSGDTVTNPTRFDAQPQFQVKGYGTFDIDGAQINVDNSALGSIISPIEPTDHTGWDNFSGTFEGFLFGNGDTVALQGKKVYCSFTHYANGSISSFSVGNAIGCSVINMSSVEPYSIEVIIPDSTFVIGTSTRISTAKFDITYTATVNGTTTSQTVTVTFYTDYYQSVNTISHSINLSAPLTGLYKSMKTITGNVVGVSSKTITGTKYIDLDIGEAWAIESGRQIPLNSVVQIPAELPTLKSGANTITYDNTFTQFDIVPRWWSV